MQFLFPLNTRFILLFFIKLAIIIDWLIPKSNGLNGHIMILILADIGKSDVKVDSTIKLRYTLLQTLFKRSNPATYVLKALANLALLIIEWFDLLNDVFPIKEKKWRVLAHSENLALQVLIAVFVKVTEVLRLNVDQGNENFLLKQITFCVPWIWKVLMKSLRCYQQMFIEILLLFNSFELSA